ncbi:MAG: hypothetical protein AB7O97_00540 [Planctomycetota bacterium]
MALRKEQVLVLATIVVGALVWKSGSGEPWRAPKVQPGSAGYEPPPVPQAPLVDAAETGGALRRWFREPSETQPLPPRDLPFPAREPLFLVALPLDPGPDLSRAELLAIPGAVEQGAELTSGEPGASGDVIGDGTEAPQAPAAGPETMEQKRERYRRQYDQVWIQGRNVEHFGVLRVPAGLDPFELEERDESQLQGVTVHLLEFSIDKEKVMPPEAAFGDARQPIVRIRLADTLKNEVARAVRKVPEDAAHVQERQQLIDWLLLQAREDAAVYEAAMAQAEVLERTAAGLVAARAKARVLQAKGDLAAEYALYRGLDDAGAAAAFKHEMLGNLEARLGLWSAAEEDLRRAVDLAPTDARPLASLARLLRDRGRPEEANALAVRAAGMLGSIHDAADRERVVLTAVGCQLGVGDVDGARETLFKLRAPETQGLQPFLSASIAYAAGDLQDALNGFRSASAAGYGPPAQLGVAACQVRLGSWREAQRGFEATAEDAPLLRHRALAGLSLLHLRIGQFDQAATWADRSLDADPQFAYAHYLRARALMGMGQLATALDALTQALRLRDDFVPALAEVAELRLRLGREAEGQDQAEHMLAAMRYADRAVQLVHQPLVPLFETQAMAHFRGADLRGAQEAFARARDVAADDRDRQFAQAGLCIVDYQRDRIEDARLPLERMRADLPREHPMREWAHETLLRIDDHAQKERLDDRFERAERGNIWEVDGTPAAEVQDNRLVFAGTFNKTGEATATRQNAVQKGGRFLAVGCTLELGPGHQGSSTSTGLRIRAQGGGGADFTAQLGLRDGAPFWLLREGRQEPVQTPVGGAAAAPGPHRLELRVLDRGDNLFKLLFVFDGEVLHEQDLTMLRANDSKELQTQFFVEARSGTRVDARFDDYQLERRKE